jgi:hypothetical protein
MITIGEAMDYIEGLAIDNVSLFDAPIQDFVIQDENGVEYVIKLEKLNA